MTCRDCNYYFECPNSYKYFDESRNYKEGVENLCRDRHKSFLSTTQKDIEVTK